MKLYDKSNAQKRMNELGAQGVPFIFVVDYDAAHAIVLPESEVDANELLYSFHGKGNAPAVKKREPIAVAWNPIPPSEADYQRSFEVVQNAIAAGSTTLVNLTCKIPIETNLSLRQIFDHADALYRLWIKDTLVCFSPEMFIQIKDGEISSYPMKGTIDATLPDAAERLLNNPKEMAEHADVVELIKQDLRLVADNVRVERYRYIDTLVTNKGSLLETSSEIRGTLPSDYCNRLGDILFSQLPAGSITGFPKSETVKIIAAAEGYERKFYTGVMGRWDGHSLDTGVLIRFIDQEGEQLYFKAGGGITGNSNWQAEYNEVIAKVYVPIR